MAGQYPGPFCEEAGLLSANLIHNVIEPKPEGTLKHGHIIELKKFADASKLPLTNLITWLNQIDKKTCEIKQATLSVRIKRVIETNKKLLHKKKVAGFKTSNEYQNSPFIPLTVWLSGNTTTKVNNNETCVEKSKTESEMSDPKKVTSKQDDYSELEKCVSKEPLVEELKTKNMLQYQISKQQKMLSKMKSLVSSEREQLGQLKSTKGHFSVRNVTKRDALAAKNRKLLREAQATIAKQKKLIEDIEARNLKLSQEDERLKHELLNSCCNESNSYEQSDTHSLNTR
ncbi:uncharacterized protein LOC128552386 [Mercenaria mercenaria]|uniref:uncharacterized protein LOC128552386 n=1 Tax=Mercenaria mercenaria TaxID=6596 RepID=UPI00234F4F71|nr:uncharacterized protein LOC128552386 [Mercenaria mercenaria]